MCILQMFCALQHFFFDCNSSFKARPRRWCISPGKSSRLPLELILGMISISVLQNDRHDAGPGITHLVKAQSTEHTPNNTKPVQDSAPKGFEEELSVKASSLRSLCPRPGHDR